MTISPLIPLVGLVLIVANIFLAMVYPIWSPTAMGVQLFIGGMTTIIISVVSLLNPIGISPPERAILFITGCIDCSAGYYMVLSETQKRMA